MLQAKTQVSPLKQNRKRSRTELDEPTPFDSEMDLDEDSISNAKLISDLSLDELKIAQDIAQEQLKASLFISVDLIPTKSKNPFVDGNDSDNEMEQTSSWSPTVPNSPFQANRSLFQVGKSSPLPGGSPNLTTPSSQMSNENSLFAPLLHSVCELFLEQENATPSVISKSLKLSARSTEIKEALLQNKNNLTINESDTLDLARIIVYILDRTPTILPSALASVCQGILAINQATTLSRRIGKTSIKMPNALVKSLARNLIILIPPLQRQLLQFLVKFSCQLCQKSPANTRNTWARQLSSVFCHLIDGKCESSPWAIVFFELLLHCHGLYAEAEIANEKKNIWSLDKGLQQELDERMKQFRSVRRGRATATPRKSVNRQSVLKGKPGTSLKRNLFNTKLIKPQSPLFLSTSDGTEYLKSPLVEEGCLDREKYSKRLRLREYAE